MIEGVATCARLEGFGEARFLEHRVGGMSRQNFAVDGELFPSGRIDPDFVIAFSMADESTASASQDLL
ncbi:MAG: hypothetical protein WCD12_07315 [Candidatus Binatus sp.]